jgi:hypothetical protein
LHLAVESAAIAAGPDDEEGKVSKGTERMEMVKHLIDIVGVDVNVLDHPVGTHHPRRLGPPICYVASLEGLMYTRWITWLLLERGANLRPGLEEAERSGHETFKEDVEAWRGRNVDGVHCPLIQSRPEQRPFVTVGKPVAITPPGLVIFVVAPEFFVIVVPPMTVVVPPMTVVFPPLTVVVPPMTVLVPPITDTHPDWQPSPQWAGEMPKKQGISQ